MSRHETHSIERFAFLLRQLHLKAVTMGALAWFGPLVHGCCAVGLRTWQAPWLC